MGSNLKKNNIQPVIESKYLYQILSNRLGRGHKLFLDCKFAIFLLEKPHVYVNIIKRNDQNLTNFPIQLATRILQIIAIKGTSEISKKAKTVLRKSGLAYLITKEAKYKHEENLIMIYMRSNPYSLKPAVKHYKELLRKKPHQKREVTEKTVDDLFRDQFGYPMPVGFLNHLDVKHSDYKKYDLGLAMIALKIIAHESHLCESSLIHLWKEPEKRRLKPHGFNLEFDNWEMLICLDAISQIVGLELLPEGIVFTNAHRNI